MAQLWTAKEIANARNLYDSGMTWKEVGQYLGCSKSAVQGAVARHEGRTYNPHAGEHVAAPAIGLTMECQRIRMDAKLGSKTLKIAIDDMFCRIANKVGLTLADVTSAYANGRHDPIPGTERVYKTASIQRLAA
jgi:hypothetical protein